MVALLLFSVFVDGAGYAYRFINHDPLSGNVSGLPPNFDGWQVYIHQGLDLSGGTDLLYQMKNFPAGQSKSDVQQRTIAVIAKRVNALGVSEPQINAVGSDQIEVQLAGVSAAKAQQVVGTTAQLVTTKWVPDSSITAGPWPGYRPQITNLRSDMLTSANASLDSTSNSWTVNITFDSQGAAIFGQLTTAAYNACSTTDCPQRHITEWLDLTQQDVNNWQQEAAKLYLPTTQGGKLVTDPQISNPITGGQAQITGNFNSGSAQNLATLLNSGSLPVTLTPISSSDVGATLGADSIRQSLLAGALGLLVVIIFMIALYRLPGLLASIALFFYAGVVLMLFKVIPVTVTLAGLTGFVLTVGMAVDANVLIFERFKEEMRAGRTVAAAVDHAVRRAWPAIRDSNSSTLITAIVLFALGSGEVQGFALTLALGVLTSLVSSIVVTHNLLAIVLNFGWSRSGALLGVMRGSRAPS